MTQEQFDINSATLEQLKALAYDQFVALQTAQNNLAVLNKAIEYKLSPAPVPEVTVTETETTEA